MRLPDFEFKVLKKKPEKISKGGQTEQNAQKVCFCDIIKRQKTQILNFIGNERTAENIIKTQFLSFTGKRELT